MSIFIDSLLLEILIKGMELNLKSVPLIVLVYFGPISNAVFLALFCVERV